MSSLLLLTCAMAMIFSSSVMELIVVDTLLPTGLEFRTKPAMPCTETKSEEIWLSKRPYGPTGPDRRRRRRSSKRGLSSRKGLFLCTSDQHFQLSVALALCNPPRVLVGLGNLRDRPDRLPPSLASTGPMPEPDLEYLHSKRCRIDAVAHRQAKSEAHKHEYEVDRPSQVIHAFLMPELFCEWVEIPYLLACSSVPRCAYGRRSWIRPSSWTRIPARSCGSCPTWYSPQYCRLRGSTPLTWA
jgi:hypothetical protein